MGPKTPNVTVFYDADKSITIDTIATGDNGVYTLPFMTRVYRDVTRIEVTIISSGSISSIEYPYCGSTPKTDINIKKYAGPVGACTATGITAADDLLYTVLNKATWAYCYEITIPQNNDECLYNVTLVDLAPIGGIGTYKVTTVRETLCPGRTVYIPGPTKSFNDAPEGSIDATVMGYGYYSGTLGSAKDGAAVKR